MKVKCFVHSFLTSNKTLTKQVQSIYVVPQETKTIGKDQPYFDKYDRMVAIVFFKLNNRIYNLNTLLVSKGLAIKKYISLDENSEFYTKNTSYYNELEICENTAKENKYGFWTLSDDEFKKVFP
ncbi:thermonuclease family protein [Mycoplasmopsis caviae]|uniref:Staphylococcal nuclease homologue n=1 Tax=Mycoplasmopsis caviae TaxID=55603 RepID=A0A3P8KW75_9BACT|nr:thermonuclease family protein [Mycoplasmopsis caviae]UUD35657.1 thermonuclease family protein [Mycoplasmopsis caviae]VDR41597.1 Staphylococcal nuclease homologue [Mycoplasmopsis caviae]